MCVFYCLQWRVLYFFHLITASVDKIYSLTPPNWNCSLTCWHSSLIFIQNVPVGPASSPGLQTRKETRRRRGWRVWRKKTGISQDVGRCEKYKKKRGGGGEEGERWGREEKEVRKDRLPFFPHFLCPKKERQRKRKNEMKEAEGWDRRGQEQGWSNLFKCGRCKRRNTKKKYVNERQEKREERKDRKS